MKSEERGLISRIDDLEQKNRVQETAFNNAMHTNVNLRDQLDELSKK